MCFTFLCLRFCFFFCCDCFFLFFFFKQKTAYEMRVSDWSSDVCSSDLRDRLQALQGQGFAAAALRPQLGPHAGVRAARPVVPIEDRRGSVYPVNEDRKSVGEGKSGSVSVGIGGRRIIKKKYNMKTHKQHQEQKKR